MGTSWVWDRGDWTGIGTTYCEQRRARGYVLELKRSYRIPRFIPRVQQSRTIVDSFSNRIKNTSDLKISLSHVLGRCTIQNNSRSTSISVSTFRIFSRPLSGRKSRKASPFWPISVVTAPALIQVGQIITRNNRALRAPDMAPVKPLRRQDLD